MGIKGKKLNGEKGHTSKFDGGVEATKSFPDPANLADGAPRMPGVYIMKDRGGQVIYVGKAKDLRSRVRSYFGEGDSRPMIPYLVTKISDIEFMVTRTDKEALILENTLIKRYKPRYNVNLKDDKNFYVIRMDSRTPFPRFELVRRMKQDGARYFGPYSSSASVKETLRFLHQAVPLRTCKERHFIQRRRPCMEFQIGRCLGPCCGRVAEEDYRELLQDALLFLEGKSARLLGDLRRRMAVAAEALEYERAASLRDRIAAIEVTLEKQRVVAPSVSDCDIFAVSRNGARVQPLVLFVRRGAIAGQYSMPSFSTREETTDVAAAILKQYYHGDRPVPDEVILPHSVEDGPVIAEWLSEKKKKRVSLVIPKRGRKLELLRMAMDNAAALLGKETNEEDNRTSLLEQLARLLDLKGTPRRMECFDISTLAGQSSVGSCVAFSGGMPDKERYRRYRIRTKESLDDCAMMYEVLRRRFSGPGERPDLVVVDGGRGQLNAAVRVFRDLGIERQNLVGIAKEPRDRRTKTSMDAGTVDRIYRPGRKNAIVLPPGSPALLLLQRIRDEAHRFAVAYHRRLKERKDFSSLLDAVPGVGPSKKKAILRHFKSMDILRNAAESRFSEVPGVGPALAALIYEHLHRREG
ncbi:MAG: excinuclease ABC subunit UvrC [Deltaproteobacteria bacterium]|nr:excinuclease ABC subunit UvrC [Deltaproteobacteria bacterium]